jgi:hypothetical protein
MRIARIVTALLLSSIVGAANAQVTYTYTGQSFDTFFFDPIQFPNGNPYTPANSVTGSFTVDSALPDGLYDFKQSWLPSLNFAFSFSEGVTAPHFQNNANGPAFPVWFDIAVAGGDIAGWAIYLEGGVPGFGFPLISLGGTLAGTHGFTTGDFSAWGPYASGSTSRVGSWTSPTSPVAAIPEPEAYVMLTVGLGLIGWAGRRKKLKECAAA